MSSLSNLPSKTNISSLDLDINNKKKDEDIENKNDYIDRFNFWIYIGFILLGVLLIITIGLIIYSLFSNKSKNIEYINHYNISEEKPIINDTLEIKKPIINNNLEIKKTEIIPLENNKNKTSSLFSSFFSSKKNNINNPDINKSSIIPNTPNNTPNNTTNNTPNNTTNNTPNNTTDNTPNNTNNNTNNNNTLINNNNNKDKTSFFGKLFKKNSNEKIENNITPINKDKTSFFGKLLEPLLKREIKKPIVESDIKKGGYKRNLNKKYIK